MAVSNCGVIGMYPLIFLRRVCKLHIGIRSKLVFNYSFKFVPHCFSLGFLNGFRASISIPETKSR